MNPSVSDLMRKATQLTQAGQLKDATLAIQALLTKRPTNIPALTVPVAARLQAHRALPGPSRKPDLRTGSFIGASHSNRGLTRSYKLYSPPHTGDDQRPLIVMLHGCTQNPDDFAAGTGMNELAAARGLFVLYPAQSADANPTRCWNWFKGEHQQQNGESALLADLTQTIIQQHAVDPKRVYIAGLSAGGAMAANVANAYPDLFAAVGVHSGLAPNAANNLSSALAAMKSGATLSSAHSAKRCMPTIVFHGDKDLTVHPRNGEQVIQAALECTSSAQKKPWIEHGVAPSGRSFTRSIQRNAQGQISTEHWLIHGAGHAWSGGHPSGSYVDASGPDASEEMCRFFLERSKDRG